MSATIHATGESHCGKLALALCLGGAALAVLIGLTASALGYDAGMWAYLLFVAFQVTAIVIGWRSRNEHLARAGAITASTLLVLSFGLLP
jgi:hypothetical protein